MPVLYDFLDQFAHLREKTADEIQLIDCGKLAIVRGGFDYSKGWADELRHRLKKIDALLAASAQVVSTESSEE